MAVCTASPMERHLQSIDVDKLRIHATWEYEITLNDGVLTDSKTQSHWNQLGQCISGTMSETQLTQIQSYQQFRRGWIDFHPGTSFYDFA